VKGHQNYVITVCVTLPLAAESIIPDMPISIGSTVLRLIHTRFIETMNSKRDISLPLVYEELQGPWDFATNLDFRGIGRSYEQKETW
jgi:hypothetical protein